MMKKMLCVLLAVLIIPVIMLCKTVLKSLSNK